MSSIKINPKVLLSILWIFVTVNYIFCDVFSLMYHEDLQQILSGTVGGIDMTQEFLLTFAFIMEIPMIMIVLARLLRDKLNRWLNIIAGAVMTFVQVGSLFSGSNTLHYIFFSVVEIATTLFIIWTAWRWAVPDSHINE
jgi:hypothetical protein